MSLFSCPSCGLPAEDVRRFVVESTDGPIEYFHTCCIQLHRFTIPAEAAADGVAAGAMLQPPPAAPAPSTAQPAPAPFPQPTSVAEPSGAPSGEVVAFPAPALEVFGGRKAWLAAGGFFTGGLSSGLLLSVPAVVALAVVMGLMAVAVVACLIPLVLSSRRAGTAQVAPLGRAKAEAPGGESSRERWRAA